LEEKRFPIFEFEGNDLFKFREHSIIYLHVSNGNHLKIRVDLELIIRENLKKRKKLNKLKTQTNGS